MVKSHVQIPHIQAIFEKDEKRSYTKEALFFQDILQYPLKTRNKEFKLRALGFFLLENNDELIKRYDLDKIRSSAKNTPKGSRFANIRNRLEAATGDLIGLKLLDVKKIKADKIDAPTGLYSHTGDGYFIAQLLRREDSQERNKANEILYELIQSNLKKNDSRHFAFPLKLYEKFKDKGMLDQAFDLLGAIIREQNDIKSVFEAIIALPRVEIADPNMQKKFHDVGLETLNSLDKDNHISQLFYIKTLLENRVLKQYPPKEWEDLQRKNLGHYSTTILYAKCHKCGWGDAVGVDTIQFVNAHIKNNARGNCPRCSSKEQLHLSTELPDRPIRIAI